MLKKVFTYFLFFIVLGFVFKGCSPDRSDESGPGGNNSTPLSEYFYKGSFISFAHPTSGIAKISKDKKTLSLESFKTDSGPNLNIYLASNINNVKSDYVDLGDIKGLNGNYTYNVSESTDFSKYKYVVIWCVDFNVNFGYATLAP